MDKHFFSINEGDKKITVYKPFNIIKPDYILVIAHGLAEHSERYYKLCKFMYENNILAYAIDQPGHGKYCNSLGTWPTDGFMVAVENINMLIANIQTQFPNNKVVLLGHSMGSFISLAYIEKYGSKVDLCLLSGTNDAQPKVLASIGKFISSSICKISGRDKPSKLLDTLSFGSYNKAFKPNKTNFDWLSKDSNEVQKYIDDPLCGFISSAGLFSDLLDGLSYIYKDENIINIPKALPIHLFGGSNDPVGDFSKGLTALETRLKNANINNITKKIYEENRHECFNETNYLEVMNDTLDKIRSVILINNS